MGNLSEKHRDNESQYYRYDADNQLIEARIEKAGKAVEIWQYRYDALGRRISKQCLSSNACLKTEFLWEGSRLLQEYTEQGCYTYVYTEQGSYEPLAQIFQPADKTQPKQILYYHTDQIGIPRELTDEEGYIVWSGEYSGWGKLSNPENACLKKGVHQPFRLQNQYADEETGLHYNFFRYYDPHCGRFTQQDPIGLEGGENIYRFGNSAQVWIDPLGLDGFQGLFSPQAASNLEIEAYRQFNQWKNKPIQEHMEGTTATQLSGNIAAVADVEGSIGYGGSQNKRGQQNKCGYVQLCGGAGAKAGAKGSLQQVFSNQSSSPGLSGSFSGCGNYAAALLGGVTGSACQSIASTSKPIDFSNKSVSAGPAVGVVAGASLTGCFQVSYCSDFK